MYVSVRANSQEPFGFKRHFDSFSDLQFFLQSGRLVRPGIKLCKRMVTVIIAESLLRPLETLLLFSAISRCIYERAK